MKKILLLTLCITMLFGVAACSPKENQSVPQVEETETNVNTSEEAVELEKIVVSEPVRGVMWAPVHLAKELNFFEEQGLDVEIVTVQGDAPTAPVLSGDAQFGLFGPEMILGLNEKGQGVKLLLTSTDKYPYSFVSGPDYDSIESLKGTVINGADSGSGPRQFVRAVLNSAGLDPNSDATYVSMPNSSIIAALESKDVSATYVSPEVRQLALDAGAKMLVDMYKPEVHKEILGSESYEMYITFALDSYIKENPETVQKYVNAIYKAILWMNEHSTEEIVDAVKPSFSDNRNLDAIFKEINENGIFTETGDFSDSGFKAINKIAKQAGMIQNDVTREQVIDDSFLKDAQQKITIE